MRQGFLFISTAENKRKEFRRDFSYLFVPLVFLRKKTIPYLFRIFVF